MIVAPGLLADDAWYDPPVGLNRVIAQGDAVSLGACHLSLEARDGSGMARLPLQTGRLSVPVMAGERSKRVAGLLLPSRHR